MSVRSRRTPFLVLLGLSALGMATFFWFAAGGDRREREGPDPSLRPLLEGRPREARAPRDPVPLPTLESGRDVRSGPSTVLWPLEVDLRLKQAAYLPRAEGVVPVGSGATARLEGRVHDRTDQGTEARVRFVAGANAGRVLESDASGRFGATDLYPGLAIVEINGPGLSGARREIRLRQGQETSLHVSWHRPAVVVGKVQDREGQPVPGATVTIDGTPVKSDLEGYFSLANVAAGKVLMEVEHPDFASTQALVMVAGAQTTPEGSLVFTLSPACEMDLVVTNDLGGPGPVQVFLLPGQGPAPLSPETAYREERFPYHRVNPIEVQPGAPRRVGGLPAGALRVYAFRSGATAIMRNANLRPELTTTLKVQFKPAETLVGTVTQDGAPAVGVPVVLDAPNRVRATLTYANEGSRFLEMAVLPSFPAARQEVTTDAEGSFRFTAWERISPTRYLEARSTDGRAWAGRLVRPGERRVDLVLEETAFGRATLTLELPGRHQGLPVAVTIDGAPLEPALLPADEDLVVRRLLEGEWALEVSWRARPVHATTLRVEGDTRLAIRLPPECIEGQDEETWRRAGRTYPLSQ